MERPAEDVNSTPVPRAWSAREAAYAIVLFAIAAALLAYALSMRGEILPDHGIKTALFFVCYGLLTISIGYQHPSQGYCSFDRVSQVASILVLGPVDAAWINGLASLLYPWHRLAKGAPSADVIYASLNNAGIMALTILLAGHLYTALGGAVPLTEIGGWSQPLVLVVLVLSMQVLNDACMAGLQWIGRRSFHGFFNGFSYALELSSGATAVLVALVYNGMNKPELVLLLVVLTLGMLALQQFAAMRQQLEHIVEERTRDLRRKTVELEQQALRDNLTDLFNRRYADRYVAAQVTGAQSEQPFAVAFADIDLFKQINDRYSHATGDLVIKRVAHTLRECCRTTDMVARYGGEEFLICFPATDLRQAQALCERLRLAVERTDWRSLGVAVDVTISFGIAQLGAAMTPQVLLDRADRNLYAAKNDGRNRVVADPVVGALALGW